MLKQRQTNATPSLEELQRIQQIAELQRDTATLELVNQLIVRKTASQAAPDRTPERVTERIEHHSRTLLRFAQNSAENVSFGYV